MGRKPIELNGQRFGRLIVLHRAHGAVLTVKCDCGVEKEVRRTDLISNGVRSCGCLRVERLALAPGKAARNEVLYKYKIQAEQRGLTWALSDLMFDDLTASHCHYCGIAPANFRKGKNGGFAYNGIDRKDSSKGYIHDNVVSCCHECNRLKGRMAYAAFIAYLDRVSCYRTKVQTMKTVVGA
jgi:hypothetical protein